MIYLGEGRIVNMKLIVSIYQNKDGYKIVMVNNEEHFVRKGTTYYEDLTERLNNTLL